MNKIQLENIKLYTTNCPNCKALKSELDKAGIVYEIESNISTMLELGLSEVPVLEVNGLRMNKTEAIDWIKKGDIV